MEGRSKKIFFGWGVILDFNLWNFLLFFINETCGEKKEPRNRVGKVNLINQTIGGFYSEPTEASKLTGRKFQNL